MTHQELAVWFVQYLKECEQRGGFPTTNTENQLAGLFHRVSQEGRLALEAEFSKGQAGLWNLIEDLLRDIKYSHSITCPAFERIGSPGNDESGCSEKVCAVVRAKKRLEFKRRGEMLKAHLEGRPTPTIANVLVPCDKQFHNTEDTYSYCGLEVGHDGPCARG